MNYEYRPFKLDLANTQAPTITPVEMSPELQAFQSKSRLRRQAPRTIEQMTADVRELGEPLADELAAKLEAAIPPGSTVRIDSMKFGPAEGRVVVTESWQGTALPETTRNE